MPCLKALRGILVINEDSDDEQELTEIDPDSVESGAKDKKKKKKGKQGPTKEELGEMSEVERRKEAQEELKYKKEPTCCEKACFGWKPRVCYVILFAIFLGLILPFILAQAVFRDKIDKTSSRFCFIDTQYRFPCHEGTEVITPARCEELDCCYDASYDADDDKKPTCYHSLPSTYGYEWVDPSQAITRKKPIAPRNLLTKDIELEGNMIKLKDKTPYNTTAYDLKYKVVTLSNNAIQILIWNNATTPEILTPGTAENPLLQAYITDGEHENFAITVNRTETGETIFKTTGALIFGEKYIEWSSLLPTKHLYGLGQKDAYNINKDFKNWEEWPLISSEGVYPSMIRYGSHPFYMCFEESNMVHGVFLKHSGPLAVKVLPTPAVSFRLVSGYIDIIIMAGPEPKDVSSQYANQVGMPAMPPYWALGFHLCRTARNASLYSNVSEKMKNHSIPYESDCIDAQLNYPDGFKPLSPDIEQEIEDLKNDGRKFILVQYPFISTANEIYNNAADKMLNLGDEVPYYGLVNGSVVGYPDYDNGNTREALFENDVMKKLYGMADGIMLLQNTPLNEAAVNYTESYMTSCNKDTPELCCGPNDATDYPFLPHSIQDLSDGTVCMDAKQTSGHKDAHLTNHNAYGKDHMGTIHTFVKKLNEELSNRNRPMITSLSTHPGSSQYGGHFGGSYRPDFVAARKGLVQVLEMGLAGIPFTGTPLCGSINKDSDDGLQSDLCMRAYQMSAFFPFMMSYTELGADLRDPTIFPDQVIMYLRLVILQRYMMLPYFYTLQWEASTSGVPPVRLLAYEFPQHLESRRVTPQFMVGSSLMITPVFNSIVNHTSIEVTATFPPGCWYDYYTGTMVSNSINGTNLTLSSLLTDINIHVRGGYIVPMQGDTTTNATTTTEFRLLPYKLLVALSCDTYQAPAVHSDLTTTEPPPVWDATAQGSLYLDDGEIVNDKLDVFQGLTMIVSDKTLTVEKKVDPCSPKHSSIIESITIMGAAEPMSTISVNGNPTEDFTRDPDSGKVDINVDFDWCDANYVPLIVTWS